MTNAPKLQGSEADGVQATPGLSNKLYLITWRWHFYSGLYVIPFMLMLALTGIVILFKPQLEAVQYRNLMFVAPQTQIQPFSAQLEAVRKAYPDGEVKQFRPNENPSRSSQVAVNTKDGKELTVFVNPYTLTVLGQVNNADRWANIATDIHGTLLIGDLGDRLIEIAAGLGILLLLTGLYMWWPRNQEGVYGILIPRFNAGKRIMWRDLHAVPGFYLAAVLLFFLISGMSWTGIWGGKYVQAWNTYPEQQWNNVPKSDQNLSSLNRTGEKKVPWNLEQSKLPLSGSMAGQDGIPQGTPVNLNTIIQYTRDNGVNYGFWVALPEGKEGVWTISAATMNGDVADARKDLTVHMDQYSGKVLANIGWNQYNPGAKAMAVGIALHQGNFGWWNQLLGALTCLLLIFTSIAGVVMWWLRRPAGVFRLAAPPMPKNMPLWKGAVLLLVILGIAFPLAGIVMLAVVLLDFLIVSRIPALRQVVN